MNYAEIQQKIDIGRGKAAVKLGQPYSVYRLGPASTGDYPTAWETVVEHYPVFRRRLKSEREVEVAIANAAMFYEIIGDMSPFLLGDVFRQTDAPYDPGVSYGAGATKVPDTDQFNAFGLAWHPPVHKSVGGRLDRLCRVYRPATDPVPLVTDGVPYWKSFHQGDQPFVLVDGQYRLGAPGQLGSLVPCGFTSAYRPYGSKPFAPDPPGMVRPTHWFAYLPPLPGYSPREGDAVITDDDARYVVVEPFFQDAGVSGSQLMLDRTTAQKT